MPPWLLPQATGRLRKNAHYFKVNYLIMVFTVTLITLAFNPTSFIVLGLLAMAWIYLFVVRQSPIVIGGRTFRWLPNAPPPILHGVPVEALRADTPPGDHHSCCALGRTETHADNVCACGCSDREKALGMAIVTLIVVFFLTR